MRQRSDSIEECRRAVSAAQTIDPNAQLLPYEDHHRDGKTILAMTLDSRGETQKIRRPASDCLLRLAYAPRFKRLLDDDEVITHYGELSCAGLLGELTWMRASRLLRRFYERCSCSLPTRA